MIPEEYDSLKVFFGMEFQGMPHQQHCANDLQYQPELLSSSDGCYTLVTCDDWDKAHSHRVQMKMTGQSGDQQGVYKVYAFTTTEMTASQPSLWSDYQIGEIEVWHVFQYYQKLLLKSVDCLIIYFQEFQNTMSHTHYTCIAFHV